MSDYQNTSSDSAPDDEAARLLDPQGLILTHAVRNWKYPSNQRFTDAVKHFHAQVSVPAAHDAYFDMAQALIDERREFQFAQRHNSEWREAFLANIPGESEFIICATSGYTDKKELIRRITSGEVAYPYRDNLPLSREQFIYWMHILSAFDRWDLELYALEGSIGNSAHHGRILDRDDIAFVRERVEQLVVAMRYFEDYDLSFLDAATRAMVHNNYQFFLRASRELHAELALETPDAARLMIALEKMAIAIAGISSKIGFKICGVRMSGGGNCADRIDG